MPALPESVWRRRLENEYAEMRSSSLSFSASPDCTEYVVRLRYPSLCREGGVIKPRNDHEVKILLKREYPYPGGIDVTWLTPIFHPNIRGTDGKVCIHLLRAWSSMQTVKSVAEALVQLLQHPNPDDPLDLNASIYYREHGSAAPSLPRGPRILS